MLLSFCVLIDVRASENVEWALVVKLRPCSCSLGVDVGLGVVAVVQKPRL